MEIISVTVQEWNSVTDLKYQWVDDAIKDKIRSGVGIKLTDHMEPNILRLNESGQLIFTNE
jgi:hypothetical protein